MIKYVKMHKEIKIQDMKICVCVFEIFNIYTIKQIREKKRTLNK